MNVADVVHGRYETAAGSGLADADIAAVTRIYRNPTESGRRPTAD